ncbi:hypothetical protein [Aureimonas leprariae]|nr:hypothetical protein [Aureimonas leprariae]
MFGTSDSRSGRIEAVVEFLMTIQIETLRAMLQDRVGLDRKLSEKVAYY